METDSEDDHSIWFNSKQSVLNKRRLSQRTAKNSKKVKHEHTENVAENISQVIENFNDGKL